MELNDYLDYQCQDLAKTLEESTRLNRDPLLKMYDNIFKTLVLKDRKVAIIGNGGSASESTHIATEFVSKCILDHKPLQVISLTDSMSSITALGNDYGFENIFARQIEAYLRKGDVLICLSTSGKSTNILRALEIAISKGVHSYLWTGNHDLNLPGVTIIRATSKSTPRIQEVHLFWGHQMAEYVERRINNV